MKLNVNETELEDMVDKFGLVAMIGSLAAICEGKDAHCAENWQDQVLARTWRRAARRLYAVAAHKDIIEAGGPYFSK